MELFAALGDHRFMDAYNDYLAENGEEPKMMSALTGSEDFIGGYGAFVEP